MEVQIQVHKQVTALRIYDTIRKKVKGDLFLISLVSSADAGDLNRGPLVQTTSVLNHSTTLLPSLMKSLFCIVISTHNFYPRRIREEKVKKI
jgi:hypothetical protein